jgi:hypothetical protein
MNFSLDKEKAIKLANQLDLKISFDNDVSGVMLSKNETNIELPFESFFTELRDSGRFISKDKDVFQGRVPIKKISPIIIENKQQDITISSSNILTGAA